MPRKKKSEVKSEVKSSSTYHKAKNGRYYKKTTVDGKSKCRFVSKAEGESQMKKPQKNKKEVEKSEAQSK